MYAQGVNSLVLSPDGNQLLTVGTKSFDLWDTSGNILAKFRRGHDGFITSAVFSPDGNQILTASYDNTARLWDTKGNLLAVFQHNSRVNSAVFSPDGNQILTAAHDHTARLWDISAGMQISAPEVAFHQGIQLTQQGTIESRQLALQKLEESLELYREDNNHAQAAEALLAIGIGNIHTTSKDWSTALNAYNQALIISQHLNDQIKQTTILNQIGKVHAASGQESTAKDYYNQALTLSQQFDYPTAQANILYNQATLNRQQNNLTAAKTEIETAITIIEQLRTQIASQQLRQSYFAHNQDYYQLYISVGNYPR